MSVALFGTVPHIAVAHRGHGNHGPPEGVRDRLEERLLGTCLREIHRAREQHDSWNTKEKRGRRIAPQLARSKVHNFILQRLSHTEIPTIFLWNC